MFKNTFWTFKSKIAANSSELVADLVAQTKLAGKTWFNTNQYSTPFYVVPALANKIPMSIIQKGKTLTTTALHKRLQLGVPVNESMKPAGGTDAHLTIFDGKTLFEFWKYSWNKGKPMAQWGGVIEDVNLSNGVFQPVNKELWGSTATSLPVSAGMIMLDELKNGVIPHMLACALPVPAPTFVSPALRTDGNTTTSTGKIPAGQIFKFPADIAIDPKWCAMIKMMVAAVRDHGMIVRDKSGCVNFYGEDQTQYNFPANPYAFYYGGKPFGCNEAISLGQTVRLGANLKWKNYYRICWDGVGSVVGLHRCGHRIHTGINYSSPAHFVYCSEFYW